MRKPAFFDAHCHVLGLSHPNFLGYVEGLRRRSLETVYSQISSPNFILTSFFAKGGERIRNILAVMEMEAGEVFELMEDDLLGAFAKPGDPEALAAGGSLAIAGRSFDRVVLVPLVLDFARQDRHRGGVYYDRPTPKSVELQIRDLLSGIRQYRRRRPAGLLEIRPFIGVNPAVRNPLELESILETAFAGYRRDESASSESFEAMRDWEAGRPHPLAFAGVKLYPPLGFDPWPEGGDERDKVEYLYGFCEKRGIPITTHCDDQGFRAVPLEEDWRNTSPLRWRKVLENFPALIVDFAHFGMQYAMRLGQSQQNSWTKEIVTLMLAHPGVYTDISFDGCDPEYYEALATLLERLPDAERETVLGRILFGSDFMVNLLKVRSWADYLRTFDASPLPEEWKYRFCSENPRRFLFGVS